MKWLHYEADNEQMMHIMVGVFLELNNLQGILQQGRYFQERRNAVFDLLNTCQAVANPRRSCFRQPLTGDRKDHRLLRRRLVAIIVPSLRQRHSQVDRFAPAVDAEASPGAGVGRDARGISRGAARRPKNACSCQASRFARYRTPRKARPPPLPHAVSSGAVLVVSACRRRGRCVSCALKVIAS